MKSCIKTSYIWNLITCIASFFYKIYCGSHLSKVADSIKISAVNSRIGQRITGFNDSDYYHSDSAICRKLSGVKCGFFALLNRFMDFICIKLFRKKSFPDFMEYKAVRRRITLIAVAMVLVLGLFTGSTKIILLGFIAIASVWLMCSSYETGIYILATYSFVDFFLRQYMAGLAGAWDELFFILMVCVCIYKGVRSRKEVISKSTPLGNNIFIFIGIFAILLLLSPDFSIGIEGIRAVCQYMLWFFVVLQLLRNTSDVKNVLMVFTIVAGFMAMHGVFQYIIGAEMPDAWVESSESIRTRVYSILSSPNIFGSVMVLAAPVTFSMAMIAEKKREKLFYIFLFLCMMGSLVFTYSRGAWIGAACAIGIYVFAKNKKLIIPAIIAGFMVLIFVPSIGNRFFFMFSSAYLSSSMKGGRLIRWITALKIMKAHPLMGLGLGQFGGAVAMNHGLVAYVEGLPIKTFYMDNYFLKIGVEAGLIGLIAFIWLMYRVFILSIKTIGITKDKNMKELEIGILAGLTGVICHNFVENVFEVPMMNSLFWMLAAIMMHMWYMNHNNRRE